MPHLPQTRPAWFLWWSRALLLAATAFALAALWLGSDKQDCDNPASTCAAVAMDSQRSENFQLEKIGGKSAVFAVQFDKWLSGWFHGQKLFMLLCVASLLCAWGCHREGRFLQDEEAAHRAD